MSYQPRRFRSSPAGFPGWLSLPEMGRQVGVSASVLDRWRSRYSWPPMRQHPSNRSWHIAPEVVDDIRHFQAMRMQGFRIDQLIEGGVYVGRLIPATALPERA